MKENKNNNQPKLEDYQRALESMETLVDVFADDVMTMAERAEYFANQRINENHNVSRIMSHPVHVVQPDTLLSDAAHLMISQGISGVPVVDEQEQLVGIITEADFLRGLGLPAHYPTHNLWQTLEAMFSHFTQHSHLEIPSDPVSNFMVRNVITATIDDDVHGVIELMKKHQIKRILVCDEERRVLGVITRSDLVRHFFDNYARPPKK